MGKNRVGITMIEGLGVGIAVMGFSASFLNTQKMFGYGYIINEEYDSVCPAYTGSTSYDIEEMSPTTIFHDMFDREDVYAV
jgi:hypothetical protein